MICMQHHHARPAWSADMIRPEGVVDVDSNPHSNLECTRYEQTLIQGKPTLLQQSNIRKLCSDSTTVLTSLDLGVKILRGHLEVTTGGLLLPTSRISRLTLESAEPCRTLTRVRIENVVDPKPEVGTRPAAPLR